MPGYQEEETGMYHFNLTWQYSLASGAAACRLNDVSVVLMHFI